MDTLTRTQIEKALGYGISNKSGNRVFRSIDNIIYTDLFDGSGTITIPNYSGSFRTSFNGKQDTSYKNEIILLSKVPCAEYSLSLSWGSEDFNNDIATLSDFMAEQLSNNGISSKKIEDFSVSYNGKTLEQLINDNYGYFVRQVMIFNASKERHHDELYF